MELDSIEGFVEVRGRYPILVTALHGFGTDAYKLLAKILRKYMKTLMFTKRYNLSDKLINMVPYSSAVDIYTWEIAYKVAVAEEFWCILPTLSKTDRLDNIGIPDYNLNKSYAIVTPFWRRVRELINMEGVKVVVDIHGMKNIRKWPDICISTRGYTSASRDLVDIVAGYFRKQGLKVAIDYPFIGGAFIAEFGRPPAVEAIAIEIKRSLRFYGSKIPEIIRNAMKIVKQYVLMKI